MTANRFDVVCTKEDVGGGATMTQCTGHGYNIDTGTGIGWDGTYIYHYNGDTYEGETPLSDYGIPSSLANRVTNMKNAIFGSQYGIFGAKISDSWNMSFNADGIHFSVSISADLTGWTGQAPPEYGWYSFKELKATETVDLSTDNLVAVAETVLCLLAIGVLVALVIQYGGAVAGALDVLGGILTAAGY